MKLSLKKNFFNILNLKVSFRNLRFSNIIKKNNVNLK